MEKLDKQRAKPLSHIFIIPIYNEAAVLERAVTFFYNWLSREWAGKDGDWKLAVANNASTDESAKIIARLGKGRPKLEHFFVSAKGRGNALKKVIEAYKANVYFYTDVDIPIDPRDIEKLVWSVENGTADIAVGKRSGTRPVLRRFLTWGLRQTTWLFFGVKFSDAQCGAKAFTRAGAEVLVSDCKETGYFLDTEFLVVSRVRGFRVAEIPVHWIESRYRDRASKVHPIRDSLRAMRAIWSLARRLHRF